MSSAHGRFRRKRAHCSPMLKLQVCEVTDRLGRSTRPRGGFWLRDRGRSMPCFLRTSVGVEGNPGELVSRLDPDRHHALRQAVRVQPQAMSTECSKREIAAVEDALRDGHRDVVRLCLALRIGPWNRRSFRTRNRHV